jgi:hypothetical protein
MAQIFNESGRLIVDFVMCAVDQRHGTGANDVLEDFNRGVDA